MPRWGRFYDRHPDVDLRLTTSLNPVDLDHGDYDLAIQVLPEGSRQSVDLGLQCHEFLGINTYPVCSPALAESIRTPEGLSA